MHDGPTSFKQEITQNLCNTNTMPALFAILPTWSKHVKVAQGFKSMILTNGWHWADRHVGFFLGDCIAVLLVTSCQLQNPCLVITHSFVTLLDTFTGILASKQNINDSNEPLVAAWTKGKCVMIHKLLPIPHLWWPTFLQETKTPWDALDFITLVMHRWKSSPSKEAAWAHSACTESSNGSDDSVWSPSMQPSSMEAMLKQSVGQPSTCSSTSQH